MRQGEMVGKKKRTSAEERAAKNKRAFDEVLGDPYGYPEPIEGHYSMLRCRSSLAIGEPVRKTPSPVNQARPTALDFFCDCENAIVDGLDVFNRKDLAPSPIDALKDVFYRTYFSETGLRFIQKDRSELEQIIGEILVGRGISPVPKYFTTIKQ